MPNQQHAVDMPRGGSQYELEENFSLTDCLAQVEMSLQQIRQSGENERSARTPIAMAMLCITLRTEQEQSANERTALREANQRLRREQEELDARSKRISERETQVKNAEERATSLDEEFARLKLGESSLNAQRELVENSFSSAQHMAAENARLEERVRGLEQMLKLPNGQTLADRIAVLTYENNNLRTQLSQARSEAAKATTMERTVQNLQNEVRRRDASSSSSSSFTFQVPQNPQNTLETPVASHSSKRRRQMGPEKNAYKNRNEHEKENDPLGQDPFITQNRTTISWHAESQQSNSTVTTESGDDSGVEVVPTRKENWRPPKQASQHGNLERTAEELLAILHYMDNGKMIPARELEPAVAQLLEPHLERFRTEEGWNNLNMSVRGQSKCAVARLNKVPEGSISASCDYCRFYKLLCVKATGENIRCILPRPPAARQGLKQTDLAFWVG